MAGMTTVAQMAHPEKGQVPTDLQTNGTNAPGATTTTTSARKFQPGHGYLAICTQITTSLDPNVATCTGTNMTWTELTNAGLLWTVAGTNGRRTQVFKMYYTAAEATLTVSFNYTTVPDILDWVLIDLGFTTSTVVVAGSEKRAAAGVTSSASPTLNELLTMNAAANTRNHWLAYAVGNVNSVLHRMELAADTGGDGDWVTGNSYGIGTGKARKGSWGYRLSNTDTTPGFMMTDAATWFTCAVEIDYAIA